MKKYFLFIICSTFLFSCNNEIKEKFVDPNDDILTRAPGEIYLSENELVGKTVYIKLRERVITDGTKQYLTASTKDGGYCTVGNNNLIHNAKWKFINKNTEGCYLIQVVGGVEGNRKYLTTTPKSDNYRIKLYHTEEAAGPQRWRLEEIDVNGIKYYHIVNKMGYDEGSKFYLSAWRDGDGLDLDSRDDNSGREQWYFILSN